MPKTRPDSDDAVLVSPTLLNRDGRAIPPRVEKYQSGSTNGSISRIEDFYIELPLGFLSSIEITDTTNVLISYDFKIKVTKILYHRISLLDVFYFL